MKTLIYIVMILVLFTSCQKEGKTQTQQQIVPEEKITKISKIDSDSTNNFGEHKGIHQIEWEEHRRERGLDTLRTDTNP